MSDPASPIHVPVLLDAVLAAAAGARRVVDATLGDGGHTAALLAAGAELMGIDRDPQAIAVSRRRLGERGVRYLEAPYADPQPLSEVLAFHPDFILLDLGVSSRQLDETGRGFTFRPGAPLDMRMSQHGWTAAAFLNESAEAELRPGIQGLRRRAPRPAAGPGSRPAPGAPALHHQRRPRQRDSRRAGRASRPPRFCATVPGGADRGQRRARGACARLAGLSRRADAWRASRGHHVPLRGGSTGEAGVPRVGHGVHLSATTTDLHLPGQGARPARAQEAGAPRRGGAFRQSARAQRQAPDLPGGRCVLKDGIG